MVIKIAARQSDLARIQAYSVGDALQRTASGPLSIQYQFRASLGDQRGDDPLWKMPEKGVFTEDFAADLKSGAADLVVHSWKDLPTAERPDTVIAATLARADMRDVLLVRRDRWQQRIAGSDSGKPFCVLTSSPRREYNLREFLTCALPWPAAPSLEFAPVRGNILTRVRKLIDGESDALVVAKAALDRLLQSPALDAKFGESFAVGAKALAAALAKCDFVVLPLSVNPTAAAQGALAVEVRRDRSDLLKLLGAIDSSGDRACVEAERRVLAQYGGGCHQKIGISEIQRPYGKVRFLRGLTDQGEVLNQAELFREEDFGGAKALRESDVYSGSEGAERRSPIPEAVRAMQLFEQANQKSGFFVARSEAWPEGYRPGEKTIVWAAGLATWKKLAAQGVWVHGSAEGLGEQESPGLEQLCGKSVQWLRLTHAGAADNANEGGLSALATYSLEIESSPSTEALQSARFFYWRSGEAFRRALAQAPQIVDGFHGCGPGRTYQALIREIKSPERIAVVFNLDEFKSRVRQNKG